MQSAPARSCSVAAAGQRVSQPELQTQMLPQARQHGWQCGRLLGSSIRSLTATQLTQMHKRALAATTLAPQPAQRIGVLPRLLAGSVWHWGSPRRSYALKAGRKRRKGGAKRAGDQPAPSTQDARIRSTPRNSLGTNFGGQQAAAAPAAMPDAFETAEHALQTLRRVYAGVKDMESSNEGMVVVRLPTPQSTDWFAASTVLIQKTRAHVCRASMTRLAG